MLGIVERLRNQLRVRINPYEYAFVVGSHKVIKDVNNPAQRHFYDEDIWNHYGKQLEGLIPRDYIIYGELVGWTPSGTPIQSHYTYDEKPGEASIYVYRVAVVNPQGVSCDLSWVGVQEFCAERGLKWVPELTSEVVSDVAHWLAGNLDTKFTDDYENAVPLSADSPCDEGVVVRIEGISPTILKAKGAKFLAHETKALDDEKVVDIEAEESTDG